MILDEIAGWIASSDRRASPSARHAARRLLMDHAGIASEGAARLGTHAAVRLAGRYRSSPFATLWTAAGESSAPYAALANRAAGDELELAAGPECVAAAVAAAEASGGSVGALLEAIAVAAEVDEYFRQWLMVPLERHGLHPPAVLGALASCAAVACIMELPADRCAAALAAAAALMPVSPYAAFSNGTSAKTLYGAWSQMLGVSSVLWSAEGIAGARSVLEGSRGVAQALLDANGAVRAPRFDPDGEAVGRATFKAFPCNRACHAPLTALAAIGAVPRPEEIDRIAVYTYPYAVDLDHRSRGTSRTAGQMKIGTMLALAILGGDLLPGGETPPEAEVRALASRVFVHVDQSLGDASPRTRSARLVVHLRGGRRLEAEALARWGLHAPATDEELRARFLAFTRTRGAIDPWTWPESGSVRALIAEGRHG